MAHYTRFELYIPTFYRTKVLDANSGKALIELHAIDPDLVDEFAAEATRKYISATQSNPLAQPLFKSWWRPGSDPPVIDYLTYLFGMARISDSEEALRFFSGGKTRAKM